MLLKSETTDELSATKMLWIWINGVSYVSQTMTSQRLRWLSGLILIGRDGPDCTNIVDDQF